MQRCTESVETGASPDARLLRRQLRETLNVQIQDGDPPETKEAFERLSRAGFSEGQIWEMLMSILAREMFYIAKEGRAHDRADYAKALAALPSLPQDVTGS